jgi:hypothetical protein
MQPVLFICSWAVALPLVQVWLPAPSHLTRVLLLPLLLLALSSSTPLGLPLA